MTELPVRLNAGDPAPEDCIAVPLRGPSGQDGSTTWSELANDMAARVFYLTADALNAIAITAEADLPLRKGDRVRVGDAEGMLHYLDLTGERTLPYLVWWPDGGEAWLPAAAVRRAEHVTLIDDHLPAREGGNVGVLDAYPSGGSLVTCPDPYAIKKASHTSDGVANVEEHVTGSQESRHDQNDKSGIIGGVAHEAGKHSPVAEAYYKAAAEAVQSLKDPDWTPVDGMLVERISDGGCFRLRYEADVDRWFLHPSGTAIYDGAGRSGKVISGHYHPRFLREGDVIDKVEGGMANPLLIARCIGEPIVDITTYDYGTLIAHVRNGWVLSDARTIHIEGLGPVPWPPKAGEGA